MVPLKQAKRDVTRVRVARDATVQSIKNLHAFSLETDNDIHKRQVFLAHHNALERPINTFETTTKCIDVFG